MSEQPLPQTYEEYTRQVQQADSLDDAIRALLRGAVRAPSTHNSQPWKFSLSGNTLRISLDPAVSLPHSDRFGKYAHISIGFLLHHILTLAPSAALHATVHYNRETGLPIDVVFEKGSDGSPNERLAQAIFARRNRRGVFENRPIPTEILQEALQPPQYLRDGFSATIQARTDTSSIRAIAGLTAEIMRRVYQDPSFRREMSAWIAPTGSGRLRGIPAPSLNIGAVASWIVPHIIRNVNIGPKLAALNEAAIRSAAVTCGLASPEEPTGWIDCGYLASHAILTLTAQHVDCSVFVASLEQEDTREKAAAVFGFTQPMQFHFVAGYLPGTVTWHTPRVHPERKMATA